jgi:hypothetical protein
MRVALAVWARRRADKKFTINDAMRAFDKPKEAISSRLSELEARKVVKRTGEVRDRYSVFEVVT